MTFIERAWAAFWYSFKCDSANKESFYAGYRQALRDYALFDMKRLRDCDLAAQSLLEFANSEVPKGYDK